jgi:hypothetical protein
MTNYFVDWGHNLEKKVAIDENGEVIAVKNIKTGDTIYTENMPVFQCDELEKNGVSIYRIDPRNTSKLRSQLKMEKTDENDAAVIKILYEKFPDKFRKFRPPSDIKSLVALRQDIQKMRISSGNRTFSLNGSEILEKSNDKLIEIEKDIEKEVKRKLKGNTLWEEYLSNIKGIGPIYAAELISGLEAVGGIGAFRKNSSFRHYCGLAVKDGKAMRMKAGEQSTYNPTMKTLLLGKIATGLLMSKNEHYRKIYDDYKKRKGPEFKNLDKSAKRKMMQQFLTDLWVVWRQLEGYSTKPDYVFAVLGHESYTPPPYIPERLLPFDSLREGK